MILNLEVGWFESCVLVRAFINNVLCGETSNILFRVAYSEQFNLREIT